MKEPTLIIGNKNYSSWSLRPWFFLRKNNLPFSEQQLWLDEGSFKTVIQPYNSDGKVPVLLDESLFIWDSLAIIEYSIERFHCKFGWPDDAEWRAHARSASYEMHSSFPALRAECPMDVRNTYQRELSDATARDIQRISEIWTQALEMSGKQEQWLYGEFSVADAMYAPVVFRLHGNSVDVSPLVQDYIDFVIADPILQEWASAARQEAHTMSY